MPGDFLSDQNQISNYMDDKQLDVQGTPREEKTVFKDSTSQPVQYVVDWSKVNNILDLIDLLKGVKFTFNVYEDDQDVFKELFESGLIMKSVKDLVKDFNQEIKEGNIIDLGWENGWGKNKTDLHRMLFDRHNPGSFTRSGKPSWQTFNFDVVENGTTYKVVYYLDSGD